MESSFVLHRRFTDFDDLAASARAWSLDLRQIDRGPFDGTIVQAGADGILLSYAHFGRTLIQQGAPPPGLRTIAVPATPSVRLEWRGRDVGGNQVMLFPSGGELHALSDEAFEVYTISVPESLLHSGLASQGADRLLACGPELLTATPRAMIDLRRTLTRLRDALERADPATVTGHLATTIGQSLFPTLASACEARSTVRPDTRARRAVDTAVEYLHTVVRDAPPTVPELAAVADVSERALRYAFRERFGVSPKQYLLAYRLNGVRRELREEREPQVGIRDAALRWGFWHMGQFAADYRRQFGELPSETAGRRFEPRARGLWAVGGATG